MVSELDDSLQYDDRQMSGTKRVYASNTCLEGMKTSSNVIKWNFIITYWNIRSISAETAYEGAVPEAEIKDWDK